MRTILGFLGGIVFLLVNISRLTSADHLTVHDPHQWSSRAPGTIESILVEVEPQGLFTEIGLTLTISAFGSNYYNPNNQLEIELFWDAEDGTFINDSWLWIEDYISVAKLIELREAIRIYEEIVNRRRDPSLLKKITDTRFEMRIYPLIGNENRKFMINYFVPTNWFESNCSANLPLNLLKLSKHSASDAKLIFTANSEFDNPSLSGGTLPDKVTKDGDKKIYEFPLNNIDPKEITDVSFSNPMTNGKYLNINEIKGEKYYQIAVLREDIPELFEPKKVFVVIDYDLRHTPYEFSTITSSLRNALINELSPNDSINFSLCGEITKCLSDSWMSASDENINLAITNIEENADNFYSRLPEQLNLAVDFINNNGEYGKLLVATNSSTFADLSNSNKFEDQLIKRMNSEYPVTAIDYHTKFKIGFTTPKGIMYGNEALFRNLAGRTAGAFFNEFSSSVLDIRFAKAVNSLNPSIQNLEFNINVQDGFDYSNFGVRSSIQDLSSSSTLLQLGKYIGNDKFSWQITGFIGKKPIILHDTYSDSISRIKYPLHGFWTSRYLSMLEKQAKTIENVDNIIDVSLEYNILSTQTAFLALELKDTINLSINESEEGIITDVEDDSRTTVANFTVSPNPFGDEVNIAIPSHSGNIGELIEVTIFDSMGRPVKIFNPILFSNNDFNLFWDGKDMSGNTVGSGAYVLLVRTNIDTYSVILIKK